ncbi:MAG: PKD domain-containing protein [Bacteroidetes bacterium]|nr:PKD domain-containing protein [Bacteroidota bacterium]
MRTKITLMLLLTLLFGGWRGVFAQSQWTRLSDFPGGQRITAVSFVIDSKIYVGLGGDSVNYFRDFWEYNPSNNVWTQKANFPDSARLAAFGFSISGKGYIGSGAVGYTYFPKFYEYDPVTDTWTQKANFPGDANSFAVSFTIGNYGYVGTGLIDNTLGVNKSTQFWQYNPIGDSWTQKANYSGAAPWRAIGFALNGKGYIGAGQNNSHVKVVYEYDTIGNSWTTKSAYPGCGSGSISVENNGFVYIMDGEDYSGNLTNELFQYNTVTDTYTQLSNPEFTARKYGIANSINGVIYVGLGYDGTYRKDFWKYEPITINLDSGLVAHYPFNGNANDESGNNNHGTVNGAVLTADRFGNANKAYNFNGTNNSIVGNTDTLLELAHNRTISAWARSTRIGNPEGIAGYYGSTPWDNNDGYLLSLSTTGKLDAVEANYNGGAGAWDNVLSNDTYAGDSIWHFIVGWRSNDTTYLYVDGIRQTAFSTRVPTFINGKLIIGNTFAGTNDQFFKGQIDDIRIYNRPLNQAEIDSLYHEGGWPLQATNHPIVYTHPDKIIHIAPEDSVADFGNSVSPAKYPLKPICFGRFNNDNYDDIAVMAPAGKNLSSITVGNLYVFYGSEFGVDSVPSTIIYGLRPVNSASANHAQIVCGDFNNDGFDDVLTGYEHFNTSGTVSEGYAILWLAKNDGSGLDSMQKITINAPNGGNFSHEIDKGDFNGDGVEDFAISAPHVSSYSGRIYVYYGGSNVDSIPDVILSKSSSTILGYLSLPCEDFNGDGFSDIATIDMPSWNCLNTSMDVFMGADTMSVLPTYSKNIQDMYWMQSTDLNGDNYSDILGTYHYDQGCNGSFNSNIRIIKGSDGFSLDSIISIPIEGSFAVLSNPMPKTDINHDGLNDCFVSVKKIDGCTESYVFSGHPTLYINTADTLLKFIDSDSTFGNSIENIITADCNGDGQPEYYGYSQAMPYKGAIFVYNATQTNLCTDTSITQTISICDGDSLFAEGAWQTISGTYTDSLLSAGGCDSIIVTQLTVIPNAEAGFTWSNTGSDVTFTNTSQNATLYFWQLAPGVQSNAANPTHTYSDPGYYNVCLTVIDSSTCNITDQFCATVLVTGSPAPCAADFTWSSTGTSVTFADQSLGSLTHFYWQFGDGNYSSLQNPVHDYLSAGIYNVKLTVFDSINTCLSEYSLTVSVDNPVNDCEAAFTFFNDISTSTVFFINQSLGSSITNYFWNFGDGSSSIAQNPVHQFVPGFYNVCLSVWDSSLLCYNITCTTIQAGSDPNNCNAVIEYTILPSGNNVKFRDASTGSPDYWNWNFGDSQTSLAQNPVTHHYSASGVYTAHLMIRNAADCISHDLELVNLGGNPGLYASYIYNQQFGSKTNQYPVDFKGAAFGDPAIIYWDFGDGYADSTTLTPTHIYSDTGTFIACFTVSNPQTSEFYEFCDTVRVIDSTAVGMAEPATGFVHIFPNPSGGSFRLVLDNVTAETISVSVVNALGAEIFGETYKVSSSSLNREIILKNVSAGVYTMKMYTGNQTFTQRISVVK